MSTTCKGWLVDELLTVTQAAKELDVTTSAVRLAIDQGRLVASKLGPRTIVIRREDLERYKATPKQAGGRPRKDSAPAQ